ncbi:MAG TPA: PAS domain S-box protein [Chthoniobacteraceae bacterium]|nr:PAS domain S-box protein [Chthoniobacteraceae bacterium]
MKSSFSNGESPREKVDRLKTQNSELRRTLQLSEEARAVLADQYDFAPVGFVMLDAKGCVREINLTAARLLACERAPLLGMPFVVHFAKEHVRTFLNHIRDCQTGSREVVCEAVLRVRGGGMVPCEFRSVPVLDPRRGDKVVRTTIIDISERLRTLRALRESDERYRELVELSPDGIFIVSKGVIVFANSSAAAICGVEGTGELVGRGFVTLARPAFSAAVGAIVAGGSSGDKATPVEIKLARGNGRSIDVEVVARPFRHEGERAVLVVARDISRRKNAERDVLKISDRERASFGRDLHDSICQSLMGTTLLAEGLAKQLRKGHPRSAALADQLARALRSCGEEARNLARGLCPITMQQHGLVAALHELASEVAARARVKCTLQCDERIMIEDTARAAHLYRIAQEAIANAIRHGDAKSVFISLGGNNGQITLRVEDNGKGLPAKPKQSGMGLHTMRYRASLIGGSIDVRRARRRGTVVTCTFSSHAA